MKHIGILVPSFPIASETFVITEINALVATGHKVTVITFEKTKLVTALDINVNVVTIDKPSIISISNFTTKLPTLFKALNYSNKFKSISTPSLLAYGNEIARLINKFNINHLHCHFMHGPLAYGIIGAKIAGITVSSIGHGHDVYVNKADLEQKVALCDFSVAVCKDMADQFKEYSKNSIKLLHCGISLEQFRFSPRSLNESVKLLFIGRLVEKKGLQFLLPALKQLPNEFNITLDVVGDGPMLNDLIYMAEKLGIRDQIKFLGKKSPDWIAQNTIEYSALIAPFCIANNGDRDTGPVVLKEAMACGVPVLTTSLMGANEIVTNQVGYKCLPGSISDITKMIYKFYLLTPHQRFEMGQNAKKLVAKQFNATHQAKKLSQWVQAL
ncbi:glycosyltransferase [Pseudoalteromonas sp. NEC-BIFX-2020_002]|uniref:Glycosyltransferase n=1 Tax=Pseudoalteromonas neustonica TaxID=1840331 RepID=A0ABU9U4N6_9GAMM|nr:MULTISPECIES: glycosyltransferase [unclassified Pseudoalteromonas]NMR24167.1 glycosyltransferase [Pseudoalteromonas sp. NEC-BIFX-2020_015]NNG43016.1 glycosyltransferase [Pseudoalteromonas sp. NEC-BIFX-2020_002]